MPRTARARSLAFLTPLLLVVAGLIWLSPALVPGRDASASLAAAPPAEAAAGRPNIVLVMTDDMRVDELRWMPATRRLFARDGVSFENSFSPLPLCCPARASFLSGVYPHNHGVWSQKWNFGFGAFDDSETLATSLQEAGYVNGFVGKYLNGYGAQRSRVTGEDSWMYVPAGWADWRAAIDNPRHTNLGGGTYRYHRTPFNVNGTVTTDHYGSYQTNVLGRMARRMARTFSDQAAPFFLYVSYVAPHHGLPVEADDPGRMRDRRGRSWRAGTPARPRWVRGRFDRVIDRGAGLPRHGGPAEASVSDKPGIWRKLAEPTDRERRAIREMTRQRAESLFVVDRQVRRLVQQLRRRGDWRNTVFMFTSDNGYYLGEHRMRRGKVFGHEPSLRVPFLVTGPGMRGGKKRYAPITTIDVTASILDLAGAEPPVRPDGASRLGVFTGKDRGWRVPILHEVGKKERPTTREAFQGPRNVIGVRTPRYSMIRYENGENELYDLRHDPAENHNRWDDRGYRDVRRTLLRVWSRLKDCSGDSCRAALPKSLRAGPAENRRLTRRYWAAIDRTYGW